MDEEKVSDSIKLATLYFKNEQYAKAVSLYNKISSKIMSIPNSQIRSIRKNVYQLSEVPPVGPLVHPKLGTVYDQCAAAFEKQNELPNALSEGKKAMECEPLSCKGYLRVSKILMMMKKDSEAYKVTQKGLYYLDRAHKLYKVPLPQKHYSTLQSRNQQLRQLLKDKQRSSALKNTEKSILPLKRSSSGKIKKVNSRDECQDPIQFLTDDILEQIFTLLPLKTIFVCHQVSKLWYKFLTMTPALYCDRVTIRERVNSQEFSDGMKFLNRVLSQSQGRPIQMFRLRSVQNLANFGKIMDQLFMSMARSRISVNIRELDIMNQNLSFHMLINQVCKFASEESSLLQVKSLRVGLNAYIPNANLILTAFPGLESLEMVILEDKMTPDCSKTFCDHFKDRKLSAHSHLRHMTLINHPKLRQQVGNVPICINDLPNLEDLKIASYNFSDDVELRQFLQNSDKLQTLYLENNTSLSITSLLRYIQIDGGRFKLRSLGIREATAQIRSWDADPADLPQLHDLVNLDLYSTSLSTRGFIRLLQVVNHNGKLSSLALRNSTNIQFANDTLARTNAPRLTLGNILEMCPDIEKLYLNEVGVDNTTLRNLARELEAKNYILKLKLLDLSFCERLDGTGILSLLESIRRSELGNENQKKNELVLHGLPIHAETLNLLQRHPVVKSITYSATRLKWREYGRNTLVFEGLV